jgi:glycerol-3-phosphate dehydrogenase (NAD(P)+)
MAIITVICSGMMGSAITFPAAHNGHTIRLVGSPLDNEIIEHGKKTGEHLTLSLYRKNNDTNGIDEPFVMPSTVSFHYFEEMENCIADADLIICGVSSFGMDWFCENVIPRLPEKTPLLSISKGMIDDGENKGHLISYPEYMQRFTDKDLKIYAVGAPCTSY